LVSALLSKKRIGPYSYKLNEVIGSGFSSVVYRGYKDNDKSQVVAIKVVQLHGMRSHRRLLLEKEIKILKMVEHPNILAFKDLYWTINNCYIITEYC
jgi:serine/threonine protein kinase